MTGARAPLRHAAPLTYPSCGRKVDGRWPDGQYPAAQRCECGHVVEATWPGFTFEPELVIVGPDGKVPGRGAA